MQTWLLWAALGAMTILWLVSLALHDASIVDRFWGLGFVMLSAIAAWWGGAWWLTSAVAVWGVRLSWHIHRRNRGHGEDPRYAAWRQQHGRSWPVRSLFQVFWLQGTILWVVALPLTTVHLSAARFGPWAVAGLLVAAAGLIIEVVADSQLRRLHVSGTVMDKGLWRYSRHPNYFGEAVVWWGFWLVALGAGFWWTLVSPILMTLLLRFVSGVPMLEKQMQDRPGFQEYAARTNAFVPWFPR